MKIKSRSIISQFYLGISGGERVNFQTLVINGRHNKLLSFHSKTSLKAGNKTHGVGHSEQSGIYMNEIKWE